MVGIYILFYILQFLGEAHSESLGELLNDTRRCDSFTRNSICPTNSLLDYTYYTDSNTQDTLSTLVGNTYTLLDEVTYNVNGSLDCTTVVLIYICDVIFPPCTSGDTRPTPAPCPNCANASPTCMAVYRNVTAMLAAAVGYRYAHPLLSNLSRTLNENCLMNTAACGPIPTNSTTTTSVTETDMSMMFVVYVTVVGALAMVCAVAVVEATVCYCCCMPTKMKMADLESGEFHVMNAVDFVYRRGTQAEHRMSRASMVKQAFFRRFTSLRLSQHLFKDDVHSTIPEPYKSLLAYKKHLVIHHKRLSLDKCLNEGALSDLHMGSLLEVDGGGASTPLTVAVRTIDTTHNESVCVQLVGEVCKMADLMHPHILNPFGLAVAVEKPLYIVYPFLENRDIISCLKMSDSNPKINHIPRINLILQIALGMDFLASRGIAHRNLSAKNCLLDSSLTVKVGGFGAPEAITSACVYSLPADQERRWKWTALELLSYMEHIDITCFGEHTDMWAFGITAWEVYSLLEPYEGRYLTDVLPQLLKGLRLPKPDNCPKALYDIMVASWHGDPGKRPHFKDLSLLLHQQVRKTMQVNQSAVSDSEMLDCTYTYATTPSDENAPRSSPNRNHILAASQPMCSPHSRQQQKQQQQQQTSKSITEPLLLHAESRREGKCKPKILPKPDRSLGKVKVRPEPPPKPNPTCKPYENLSVLVLPKCQTIPINLNPIYYNETDDTLSHSYLPEEDEEYGNEYIICTKEDERVNVIKENTSDWIRGYSPHGNDLIYGNVYENPPYRMY